jgi:hypothetical protein
MSIPQSSIALTLVRTGHFLAFNGVQLLLINTPSPPCIKDPCRPSLQALLPLDWQPKE